MAKATDIYSTCVRELRLLYLFLPNIAVASLIYGARAV